MIIPLLGSELKTRGKMKYLILHTPFLTSLYNGFIVIRVLLLVLQ